MSESMSVLEVKCVHIMVLRTLPPTGYIRDVTDSYEASIWVLAGITSSSLILWAFMPVAERYDRRNKREEE